MKYCLSVFDIYGTDSPKIPEGYKLTGEFRPPLKGEWFISLDPPNVGNSYPNSDAPKHVIRLILEKLPPPPTIESIYGAKEPKIPEGYESTGELRDVKDGDIYLSAGLPRKEVVMGIGTYPPSHPRLILRKVKTYSDADIVDFLISRIQGGYVYIDMGPSVKEVTKAKIIEKMREKGI